MYNIPMLTLPDYVQEFMQTFTQRGFQIYVVGGAIRDLLMGKTIDNWDFATNAVPEEILKLFPDAFYHNTYGTVTVPLKLEDKTYLMEVTPYRTESGYENLRHPTQIAWAKTLEEDLSRRDFTINAIASNGEKIIDPYGGQTDLEHKRIVAVGDPDKRFGEDALRLLRAVRFAAQLGFIMDENTRISIKKNAELITNISWERIRDEFLKILSSDHPAEGVLFLRNTDLLKYILPEVNVCFDIPQKSPKRHHIYDVGTHLVMSLRHCPSADPITRFATLIHDIGKAKTFHKDPETSLITFYNHEVVGAKQAEKIASRFRLSNKQAEKLVRLVAMHQFTVTEIQTDKTLRRFIREVGKEYLQDILDVRSGDRIGSGATPTSWRLELFKKRLEEVQQEPFTVADLKVDGHDVMELLKLKPGPLVGEVLNALFDDVVENKVPNEREILLEKLPKVKVSTEK